MFSKPKEYDQATQLLKDLHEIARREEDTTAFTARVSELRTRYAKRPSLMKRFRQGRTATTEIAAGAPAHDARMAVVYRQPPNIKSRHPVGTIPIGLDLWNQWSRP